LISRASSTHAPRAETTGWICLSVFNSKPLDALQRLQRNYTYASSCSAAPGGESLLAQGNGEMKHPKKIARQTARLPIPLAEKVALTMNEAASVVTLGRTKLYQAIREGRLRSRIISGRRTILLTDIRAFYANAE
jgi:hypothetical protein